MEVRILSEWGYDEAIFGLGFSRGITIDMIFSDFIFNELVYERMAGVAEKLYHKDNGENKFLESMGVWLDITAPLFFWKHLDTYRAPQGDADGIREPTGVTKQSGSTMYGILKRDLTQADFELSIISSTLMNLNGLRRRGEFIELVNALPSGYLQRREVKTNYKVLRHIYAQRKDHKLAQWHYFFNVLFESLAHPKFIK